MAEEGGEIEEIAELQIQEEQRLEKLFAENKEQYGLESEITLGTFFKLFDMWIQLYRLNKCSEALVDIVPICRKKGGTLHVKGVQALAFTVWKQSDFRQAATLFHEIEELIGPSSALAENIGHTYSSLGDYDQASKYFRTALSCLDEEEKAGKKVGDRGGILLGLGLIEDRLGRFESALEAVREAHQVFRKRANGKPSSLVAKAGMSVAKILLKLSNDEQDEEKKKAMEEEALKTEHENVELFEVTCGEDSPLTASALKGLGEAQMRRSLVREAQSSFQRSYHIESIKDSFDLLGIMEVHNLLFNAHMSEVNAGSPLDRAAFKRYMPIVDQTLTRVKELPQDANAGAYYKVAGEMRAFAEEYREASELLSEAIRLFATEDLGKVFQLIKSCHDLKEYCDQQGAKSSRGPTQRRK